MVFRRVAAVEREAFRAPGTRSRTNSGEQRGQLDAFIPAKGTLLTSQCSKVNATTSLVLAAYAF